MKKGFFLFLVFVSNLALAMSGKMPPPNDGSGRPQCAFYDDGKKEEHKVHLTLADCNQHHRTCQERCYTYYQKCTVEGIHREYVKEGEKLVEKETTKTYTGSHRDYGRALEMAYRQCETAFPTNQSCLRKSCYEEADRIR